MALYSPSPPVDSMPAVRAEQAAVFVQPAVLTPTHRCQRYSVHRASCLQAAAAPALLWLFTLPALTSALFPHRKRLSYPAANLRFIKRESHEKKKYIYIQVQGFFSTQQVAPKFGPYLSFFHRHPSVLGWIPAEDGLRLSCQHYCDRICESCLETASSTRLNCFGTVFVR